MPTAPKTAQAPADGARGALVQAPALDPKFRSPQPRPTNPNPNPAYRTPPTTTPQPHTTRPPTHPAHHATATTSPNPPLPRTQHVLQTF